MDRLGGDRRTPSAWVPPLFDYNTYFCIAPAHPEPGKLQF